MKYRCQPQVQAKSKDFKTMYAKKKGSKYMAICCL